MSNKEQKKLTPLEALMGFLVLALWMGGIACIILGFIARFQDLGVSPEGGTAMLVCGFIAVAIGTIVNSTYPRYKKWKEKKAGKSSEAASSEHPHNLSPEETEKKVSSISAGQCPSCGSPITSGAMFCLRCGAEVGSACPTCGEVNPLGSTECRRCKNELKK